MNLRERFREMVPKTAGQDELKLTKIVGKKLEIFEKKL